MSRIPTPASTRNIWTNDFNAVFGTDIDFPVVQAGKDA